MKNHLVLCLFVLTAASSAPGGQGGETGAVPTGGAGSIQALVADESQAEVQTFSFPNDTEPDFSMDFPSGWKMEATEQGTYVESPDKLVAMNVIMVDTAEVNQAVEALKKSVGERFQEILWNGGEDPEVNKDEDLGLTATFHHAVASDGEGTEKYSINLITYVRKEGDKALVFLTQNPLRALDTHVETMEAVVKSIKVR